MNCTPIIERDENGNLLVNGVAIAADVAASLVLDDYEIGFETDTEQVVVGLSGVNRKVGRSSRNTIHVVPGADEDDNEDLLIQAVADAEAKLVTMTKEGVSSFNGTPSPATTDTTIVVDNGAAFYVGDLITWGTNGSGSGAFNSTTFAAEWMLVTGIAGNTLTVTRARRGTNASPADNQDIYRIKDRVAIVIHAGRYNMTTGFTDPVNHIDYLFPDGPDATRIAYATTTAPCTISGGDKIIDGIGFSCENTAVTAGWTITLSGRSRLRNLKQFQPANPVVLAGALTLTGTAVAEELEALAVDMSLTLGDTAVMRASRIEIIDGFAAITLDGTGAAPRLERNRIVSANASVLSVSSGGRPVLYYNTIITTNGTPSGTITFADASSADEMVAAHNIFSHGAYQISTGAEDIENFNAITTGANNTVSSEAI